MKTALRRGMLAAVPVVAIGLTGCSMLEGTQQWYDATDGVSVDAGDVGVRDIVVVTDGEGRATVLATFANRGDDDQLVEVVVGGVSATPADGALDLPGGGYARVGPDDTRIDLDAVDATPGLGVDVEFRFADAERASVEALVKAESGLYADIIIKPAPELTPVPDETPPTDAETPPAEAETPPADAETPPAEEPTPEST